MKRIFTLLVAALAFAACSTFDDSEIWDRLDEYGEAIKDHESRIAALEELCKQMNTNLKSLQAIVEALEKRDYITNVAPVTKDGTVVGYVISFAASETITIYHGEDGKDGNNGADGADGKDGITPQIGVKQDSDGIYYWTINGEWLLDAQGNKVRATGEDGKDGENGTNGSVPKLKIEDDAWFVSYDDGATWIKLGNIVEAGGDNIYSNVMYDEEFVYFTLADGVTITLPRGNNADDEYIHFLDNTVELLCIMNWDTNGDEKLSYSEAAAVKSIGGVFRECSIVSFNELQYFSGLTTIESYAFSDCRSLYRITLPNNVTTIGDYAFRSCDSLTGVTIPDSVTTIGEGAFSYCNNLEEITIGYGVMDIAPSIVSGCYNIKKFNGKFTSEDGRCLIIDGILVYAICSDLTSYTIPSNVIVIDENVFAMAHDLKSITIPEGVTTIGYGAFAYCSNLKSIVIPNSTTTISASAFEYCSSLQSVTIGNGIEIIDDKAFWNCGSLIAIYCTATTPPSIYYYRDSGTRSVDFTTTFRSSYGSFPLNLQLWIYVPYEAYNNYMQYSDINRDNIDQTNWYAYKEYILPYDFEKGEVVE